VARPWRRDHLLVDLPGQTIQAAQAAGLHLVACRRAVHAAARDGRLVPHHTFWQLSVARASRRKGIPVALVQHDDIAVFAPGPSSDGNRDPIPLPGWVDLVTAHAHSAPGSGPQLGQLGAAAEPPAVRGRPVGPWVGMTHHATIAAHRRDELVSGNRLSPPSGLASGSLTLGRHRGSSKPRNTRHAVGRAHWPHHGESRYGPAPLHPRGSRLQNESQKTNEADDHFDQHLNTGTHRPNAAPDAPTGTTR
jgi:hypothetical protein